MGDSTIAGEKVLLLNNWPDGVIPDLINTAPSDGFTGAAHHDVVGAKYPIGVMSRVYNRGEDGDGIAGWATLMYARNKTTAIAAAFELCQPADAADPYYISSTVANALIINDISMMMATSISAMSLAYYGWFLVGGVCPVDWIAAMDGDFPTNDSVIIGQATCGAGAGSKAVLEPQTAGELDSPVAWCLTTD